MAEQSLFNAGDTAVFYAEFDELAKVQFSQEDLAKQLGQFANIVGKIEDSGCRRIRSADGGGRTSCPM